MKRGVSKELDISFFPVWKKAQTTIFIILAIIIVVVAVLIYQFSPKMQSVFTGVEKNPEKYLEMCLYEDLQSTIETISLQGGFIEPPSSYLFDNTNITYLCYTSEYYKNCVNQVPFLKVKATEELTNALDKKVNECLSALESDYTEAGYSINIADGEFSINILPTKISMVIDRKMTISKGDNVQTYDGFEIIQKSGLYRMLGVTKSIIEYESNLGQADPVEFMVLYRNLKIEKLKQSEGTKIYILTDEESNEKFQFASRSAVFPPGYI